MVTDSDDCGIGYLEDFFIIPSRFDVSGEDSEANRRGSRNLVRRAQSSFGPMGGGLSPKYILGFP